MQQPTLMDRNRVGSLSFTYPASVVLGATTMFAWILFAAVTRAAVPACELLPRTAWAFTAGAASAAFLLPFTYVEQRWLRIAAALAAAAAAGAVAFWATAELFPRFC